MRNIVLVIVVLALFLSLFSCGPKKSVTRTSSDEVVDLSGRWNDTDSRLVSEEMIRDCLERPWVTNFTSLKHKSPVVIVGRVLNKSQERIATETFVKDLERALINDGRVEFVASSSQRAELREERGDQAMNASEDTQAEAGQEAGANFMVQGQINTILDEAGGQQVRYYQVELEMIDMKTNKKVWMGQKKIKKVVDRKKAGW